MWGSVRAETTKLVRRSANWLLLGVAIVLALLFTYVIPYAGVDGVARGAPNAGRGLAALLPDRLVGNSIAGLPVFVGALVLILGVLAVGGEYGWGTWKTVLGQGPSRRRVYAAKVVVLCGAALCFVLAMFVVGAVASAAIAAAKGQPMHWPGAVDLLRGVGAGWLIAAMWALLGGVLGIVLRGVALPVGLGLVWMLAVQNLLAAIAAPLLHWVAEAQKGLPGPNAGSLVAALGADVGTPGVAALVAATPATLVVAAYAVGFALLGGVLLGRHDIQ
jgi:ABC-type transport system involved in multi-copper enzyme maturation permease subunit